MGDQRHHRRAGEHRQALPHQLPRAIQALAVGRRALHQKRRGACVFATGSKALQHARYHDQQRRTHADGQVVRCERDHGNGHRHQADDQLHRCLAPLAVGIHAQQHPTHRAHEKAHTEGGQGHQQGAVFIVRGEELAGDDARQKAVHDKVIPLQRITDDRRHHLPGTRRACIGNLHAEHSIQVQVIAQAQPRPGSSGSRQYSEVRPA